MTERKCLGSLAVLFFGTYILHGLYKAVVIPGDLIVNCTFVALITGIALLEYFKPWRGVSLFLALWPTMWILREAARFWIGPQWELLPDFWGAPGASALSVGCWLRFQRSRDPAMPSQQGRTGLNPEAERLLWIAVFRYALWGMLFSYFISSLSSVWRMDQLPSGWVLPKDFKMIPLTAALSYASPLVLGLLLLNQLRHLFTEGGSVPPRMKMIVSSLAGGIVVALVFLTQMRSNVGWGFAGGDPHAGPFFNRNTTAPYFCMIGMLWFAMASEHPSRPMRASFMLSGFLFMVLTFLTQSRNGVWMVLCMISLMISALAVRKKFVALAVSGSILGLTVLGMSWLKSKSWQADSPLSRLVFAVEKAGEGDLNASGRGNLFKSAILIFRDYPWVGSGPGTFSMLTDQGARYGNLIGGRYSSAHSMPLNLLAENGLLGAFFWSLAFIFLPLWIYFRSERWNLFALSVAVLGAGNLFDTVWMVPSMTGFSVLLIFWACDQSA